MLGVPERSVSERERECMTGGRTIDGGSESLDTEELTLCRCAADAGRPGAPYRLAVFARGVDCIGNVPAGAMGVGGPIATKPGGSPAMGAEGDLCIAGANPGSLPGIAPGIGPGNPADPPTGPDGPKDPGSIPIEG